LRRQTLGAVDIAAIDTPRKAHKVFLLMVHRLLTLVG